MSDSNSPVPVLCRYRVKPEKRSEFEALLQRHWQVLHGLGLATDEPARLLRASDKQGHYAYVETFSWATGDSAQTAHETPGVMELWEPMGALCDDMEFWEVESMES